jgi:hypothetical protein
MNDQETTDNFLKVWSEFKWPDPVLPSYRLYINEDGSPKCYSMDVMSDKYIEVDAETFALRPWNVKVVEGKLLYINPLITVKKLYPNYHTGTACHRLDVCVVVLQDQDHQLWSIKTNEVC